MTDEEIESLHNELADYQFNYPTIKELQEEIARLKKENKRLRKESEENQDLATIAYMQGMSKNKAKLDEAKEIIREYMRFAPMIGTCSFYSEEYEQTKKKAEAFLKE